MARFACAIVQLNESFIVTAAPMTAWLEWLNPTLQLPPSLRQQTFTVPAWQQILIALLLNIMSLSLPIMMLQVYDRIIPHKAYNTLTMLLMGVLVVLILDASLRLMRAWLISWMATTHEYASGCLAMARITRAQVPEFSRLNIGAHMQNWAALGRLREFYSGQTLTALVDLPFVMVFLFLIGYLGGALAAVPVVLLSGFIVFAVYAGRRLKHALAARTDADDRKASYLVSVLGGIHTVKAMGMEMPLVQRFEAAQKPVTTASYQVALASGLAGTLSAGFAQLSLILTATIGSLLVIHGDLSIGGLSACTLLAGRVLQPVQRVLGTWLRLQDIALARVLRHAPAVLLFDDADRALDKDGYNLLFRMIGAMKGRCTMVMVSNDQNLLSFADRFYQLQDGMLQPTVATPAQNLSMLVPMRERRQ